MAEETLITGQVNGVDVYAIIPEGWSVTKGATNAPKGYIFISNMKSRFGGERKIGLISDKNFVGA